MAGRIAAFFDFDNTLLGGDSAEIGIRYMIREREISFSLAIWLWFLSRFYKRNLLSLDVMSKQTLKIYRGRRLEEFARESNVFYTTQLQPYLSPVTRERLEYHRRQGHALVLLSAGLEYILREVMADLKLDYLLCSKLEENADGILTGHIDGDLCAGPAKAVAARGLALKEGFDLSASYAYGDHHSDISILSIVGHPVAVNPTRPLHQHAETNGWEIIPSHQAIETAVAK